jgi:serine O-acetyltransferase
VTHGPSQARADWRSDRRRYGAMGWCQRSLWAVAVYRFGRWVDEQPTGLRRRALALAYWAAFLPVETLTGVSIIKDVRIGPGLRIHHAGPIVVNAGVRIGANCTMEHGVTLGVRRTGGPVPTLGDGVMLGAYAQVLGGVRVGDGAQIGALTLVLDDVPDGATAVGVPARVIDRAAAR